MNSDGVAERLAEVRRRIRQACERCGRDPREVTLVGVSKRQPLERVRAAVAAGLGILGEIRVQEAVAKSSELDPRIDWHFLGPLQSNKVKPAVRLFSTIHSVDRLKIARRLDREAAHQGRRLTGFLEVNLGAEPSKHGFSPAGLGSAVEPLAGLENLEIVGLMAIPPYEEDLVKARWWFRELRRLGGELGARSEWAERPAGPPRLLSMGMTHDFEVAIEEGATHVRVGTAIFGRRPDGPG